MRLYLLLGFLAAATLAHSACGEGTTIEAYANTPHDTPYVLSLCKGPGKLLYIGIDHSTDPKSQTIKTVQGLWLTEKPDVVLVEGGQQPPPPSNSFEEAVHFYAEAGATTFLARQRGTYIASLELPFDEECGGLMILDTLIGGIITYRGNMNGQHAQEV